MEEKGASLYLIRNYLYYSRYSGGLVGQQAGRGSWPAGLLGSLRIKVVVAEIMESPRVARSLYVYKSQLATHRQIIKQFYSPLSWHNLTKSNFKSSQLIKSPRLVVPLIISK